MTRKGLILGLLLLLAVPAAGGDEPSPPLPPVAQAAAKVREAVDAGDPPALAALARRDDPDPWLVADALIAGGGHDYAHAFALAAPRAATARLPAYVEGRRGASDEAARAGLAEARAAAERRDWAGVLRAAGILGESVDAATLTSVPRIRLARERARALVQRDQAVAGCEAYGAAGTAAEAVGWERALAAALLERARVQVRLGQVEAAVEGYLRAAVVFRTQGDSPALANALFNCGEALRRLWRLPESLRCYDEVLALGAAAGNERGLAHALNSSAAVLLDLGRYDEARARCDRAEKRFGKLKDEWGIAFVQTTRGRLHLRLGEYGKALHAHTEALRLFRPYGRDPVTARALNNLGNVQLRMGSYDLAIASYLEALAIFRGRQDERREADALTNLGMVELGLDHHDEAQAYFEQAVTIFRARKDDRGLASVLNAQGLLILDRRGDPKEARTLFDAALGLFRTLGDHARVAAALNNLGQVHVRLSEYDEAEKAFTDALASLAKAPNSATRVKLTWSMAWLRFEQKRPKEAIALVRQGVDLVADLAENLAEGEEASARDRFGDLFDVGVRASLAAKDTRELHWMFERGRADGLRKGLVSRSALEAAVVPEHLRRELDAARAAERREIDAYRKAVATRELAPVRAARARKDAAHVVVDAARKRIEREAKAAAQLVFPAPDDLETVRGYLAKGEALVSYGLAGVDAPEGDEGEAVALVITCAGATMKPLGSAKALHARAAAFDASDRRVDNATVLEEADALRKLLVEPLGLGADVTRVLISPTDVLAYVPFALLFGDREVAYVPSATTYGLLLAQRDQRGKGVLALGAPDYTNHPDRPEALPKTRTEVEKLGTVPLLGPDATETALPAALSKSERWHAVHFACHGIVDRRFPGRSRLLVTPDEQSDGCLTCLEVFRLRIPTDLVVLSACETGRGKIHKTEGIAGLTRAFMFAGAPRVICSLWKVDDEATRELMLKFYEVWEGSNPKGGVSTAEALRRAQAHVRDFTPDRDEKDEKDGDDGKAEKPWAHPYFWAAWVLWGLPQ